MLDIEECIARYRRIIALLDSDSEKFALAVQGEILNEYRKIIQLEKDALEKARQTLQYY